MANVTGKTLVPFKYKGKSYGVGDEVTMTDLHAARHEKLNYVKFNREAATKIETAVEKQQVKSGNEKNSKAGPGK